MSTDQEPRLLYVADIARMFGVSRDTVKSWAKSGKVPEAGRTKQGWRYYLFTDIEKILRDTCGNHR